jgi:heme/copper-type cytochrome/quinol oxidase subunit 3
MIAPGLAKLIAYSETCTLALMRPVRWTLFASVAALAVSVATGVWFRVWTPRHDDSAIVLYGMCALATISALVLSITTLVLAALALRRPAAQTRSGYMALGASIGLVVVVMEYFVFFVSAWGAGVWTACLTVRSHAGRPCS